MVATAIYAETMVLCIIIIIIFITIIIIFYP